jgi:ADP-L-glycero-D-manno-heptose 6-epimerase
MIPKSSNILITGAGGFIGGYFARYLNQQDYYNLILVDNFHNHKKITNTRGIRYSIAMEREYLFSWLNLNKPQIDFVIHLGAKADTTETDRYIFDHLNFNYSKQLFEYCEQNKIPIIYASSAATYGRGEFGFTESIAQPYMLKPLNEYAISKNRFDRHIEFLPDPPFWAGLKFFNVYGEGERIKGKMASMVNHGYKQIMKTGKIQLFKSYLPEFKDGEQKRDFVYIKDVVEVIFWMMNNHKGIQSGIYNVGTGVATSFNELAKTIFAALELTERIEYIDMPEQLQATYQDYTRASTVKLHRAGYQKRFRTLEEGVKEYLKHIYKNEEWGN